MKFSKSTIIVAAAFLFIVAISLYGGCKHFAPFSFDNNLAGSPYESFGPMLEYTTYDDNKSIDSFNSKNIGGYAGIDKTKLRGFDGLFGASSDDDSSLDIYSKAKGKNNCQSYGLTNSMGNLCLNDNQINLLTSRGGQNVHSVHV